MHQFILGLVLGLSLAAFGEWAGARARDDVFDTDTLSLGSSQTERLNRAETDVYDVVPGLPKHDPLWRYAPKTPC